MAKNKKNKNKNEVEAKSNSKDMVKNTNSNPKPKSNKNPREAEIKAILQEFDKDLATAISQDIKAFLEGSALSIKGPILKEPTIQINLSDDFEKLTAILRETTDKELEKTYFEIDLLSDGYPKNSNTRKLLDKVQKKVKKITKK